MNTTPNLQSNLRAYDLKHLFLLVAEQNEQAFNEVYKTQCPYLITYIKRLVNDNALADEIIQDTFIALWQKGPGLKAVENPGGWLRDVSCKISINYYRKQQRYKKLHQQAGLPSDSVSGYQAVDFLFLQQALGKGLEQLSPGERRIIRLHLDEGKGRRQLAKELALSEKAVRIKLEKAWVILRRFLLQNVGIWLPLAVLVDVLKAINNY